MKDKQGLFKDALALLKQLIGLSSLSKEEEFTADLIDRFFQQRDIKTQRKGNNIWVYNAHYDSNKPTILLNSHHDTVKPNTGYTRDPLAATVEEGKLYGLGSNDAGGCLVSLIATFLYFYQQTDLKYNFCIVASAEEEISGKNGIESVLDEIGPIDFAIVGEPTLLDLAIAEKGLMVLDCTALGTAGHAARDEGDNAIYKAIRDIEWFQNYTFERTSPTLGPIKMSVTVIQAGSQHNVVPATCNFVVDVRTTDAYSNEETLDIIKSHVKSEVTARSTRLKSSSISDTHPIVKAGIALGRKVYGSPTMSDQALIPVPSLKLGPGDSARSHMADEFIYIDEIRAGIDLYIGMLEKIV
ncbi:M20 family metallo-hydrolase [Sphingobacterium zeae]|uniref:Acetylornithine deacetylase n=1 Tax=Sphingobacterium zeae TaxID=1776859 RepID=A0ABU0UCG7_9SPHI|nr:M20 family metallo-hydrolase [Sphingobacterium zeae]MDQ1152545.1 acetylornithine deacetylase [Sphingobacterium zeae]